MKPAVIFVWANFGPYHVDRLEAAAASLENSHRVVGIEIAGGSEVYPWSRIEKVQGFERVTLFPDLKFEQIPYWRTLISLAHACLKARARHIFLCHYERLDINLLALLLRVFGCRVYSMIESKFDDKQRFLGREILKKIFFLPYQGAIVGGDRSRDNLRFFGFDPARIQFGYDTVSMERIRRLAGAQPAPAGIGFNDRHFTIVARLVPKKNIIAALSAYADYCRLAGSKARELHICGSGELESELRAATKRLGLDSVVFRGFVQSAEVAQVLSSTLALILPSVEEQWGLVINEALAMGVPILCSLNVGARDLLVRTAINGYLFEPDNPDGLARLFYSLGSDEDEWRRLAEGSSQLAPIADTAQFGKAIARMVLEKSSRKPFSGHEDVPRIVSVLSDGARVRTFSASKKTWPKFFLVGAPKAGTTAIVESLEQHPDVYSAPVKEPNFFNPDVWVEDILPPPKSSRRHANNKQFFAVVRDETTYSSLYENTTDSMLTGDYSVNYLRSRLAPYGIHERVDNAKIIIVLRNPADRAYSHYLMDCSIGRVHDTFTSVIDKHIQDMATLGLQYDNYIQCGLYADHIETYLSLFGKENVLILLYENLIADFTGCMEKIANHIGLPEKNFDFQKAVSNTSRVAKIPIINFLIYQSGLKALIIRYMPQMIKNLGSKIYYEEAGDEKIDSLDRLKLINVHRSDIQRTAKLISQNLDHWLR
jgi:glycosyltransferase involved in cell wall biosynthesis